ncbi:MAG: S8 family peptidase [Planctomycetota bacterium]
MTADAGGAPHVNRRQPATAFMVSSGALLSAACIAAAPAPDATSPADTASPMAVAQGTTLLLDEPDARSSLAAVPPAELADKLGRIPSPRFDRVVHARVITRYRAEAGNEPTDLLAQPGVRSIDLVPGVPGFIAIECDSVRAAAALMDRLADMPAYADAELDIRRPTRTRSLPSDPSFADQWHLANTGAGGADLNVTPVWAMGITGAGVTVGVVEGGWQDDHPDLVANFDAEASMPGGSATSHATSCAGIIAASANNGQGGVGVAFGSRIANLIYGGPASATAEALAHRNDLNSIKSNSWGPPDFGILADISAVELVALEQSAQTGRSGLGTIFVWAAGNGGSEDRVDYDPFASSRHTIAINPLAESGTSPDYAEPGSSVFAVTPSDGDGRGIYTTANASLFNPDFGGTSAACPQAAGVIALMLEANPALSARDVRHIIARSARRCDPADTDWAINAGGHEIHPHYGFGAIDAHAAVLMAQSWDPIGPEVESDSGVLAIDQSIPDNSPVGVTISVEMPDDVLVEHAELILDVSTNYVGDLSIDLESPGGTISVLAEPRDDPQNDLDGRVFTSVRHWDEPGQGVWTVRIADRGPLDLATWHAARLVLYGTARDPSCGTPDLAEPFGEVNFFDLVAFLAFFNDREPSADLDGNGSWNFFDLSAFIAAYNAGCP